MRVTNAGDNPQCRSVVADRSIQVHCAVPLPTLTRRWVAEASGWRVAIHWSRRGGSWTTGSGSGLGLVAAGGAADFEVVGFQPSVMAAADGDEVVDVG